jgi:hypothetical protein
MNEKQIKEHMDSFGKSLDEYKKINEKNVEIINLVSHLPHDEVVKIMTVVGEVVVLAVEACVKAVAEAERVAELYSDHD